MWIKMLDTRRGSEDGHISKTFHKGESYDVADSLARSFMRQGIAEADQPIVKLMDQVKMRLDYNEYLADKKNPPITFERFSMERYVKDINKGIASLGRAAYAGGSGACQVREWKE